MDEGKETVILGKLARFDNILREILIKEDLTTLDAVKHLLQAIHYVDAFFSRNADVGEKFAEYMKNLPEFPRYAFLNSVKMSREWIVQIIKEANTNEGH